jgi:AraC family transcriptional regulator
MSEMATAIALFESRDLFFAELSCPPDDPEWGEDNQVTRSIIALPTTPVWQVHDGSERQLFNQNDVVFHHPGSEYRRERFQDVGYRCLFLIPTPALLREVAIEFDPAFEERTGTHLPVSGPLDGRTFGLSRLIARYLRRGMTEMHGRESLYEVLRGTVRASKPRVAALPAESEKTRRARREIVEEAKAVLTSRMGERISIDDLARHVYTSPYHLARLFRAGTGFSVHGYLTQLRLRTGLDRIQGRHGGIGEVGLMLGFSSHSHFTASFRRAFGLTPSAALAPSPALAAS